MKLHSGVMLGLQNIASVAGAAAVESEVLLLLVDIAAALEVAVPVQSRYFAF